MPKIVDHDARRREIIEAVWTLISSRGFGSVTMRELAAEAGYANGALARYFPDKDAALRLLVLEIMPLDEVRRREARVVIGFWDHAAGDPDLVEYFDTAMAEWRGQVQMYLRQARATGEIPEGRPDQLVIDTLLALTMGLQINALFMPRHTTPERQLALLEDFLGALRGSS
jgi:AcrR family transcriptional regulator